MCMKKVPVSLHDRQGVGMDRGGKVFRDAAFVWIGIQKRCRGVPCRRSPSELERRRAAWKPPARASGRGYVKLYYDHVMQADRGADLDFLVGASGAAVPKESH
jgi:hypothetical protein